MGFQRTILFSVAIVSCFFMQTEGADKYTDGNRPYEFGFNIEGEQHRHEKKDENGLIMGEFGFITADGVYHVTVYATDEQGRFKILSMKNIRVKPYPTYKRPETGSERQGHSLELPRTTIPNAQVRKPEPPRKISIEPPARSCSSCSLPTTQAPAPAFVQPNYNQNALVNPQTGFNSQKGPGQSSPSFDPSRSISTQNSDLGGVGISRAAANAQTGFNSQNVPNQGNVYPQPISPSINPSGPITNQLGGSGIARTAKKYDGQSQFDQGQELPKKPILISAQMQIVDKNTDIHRRGPGEKEGLPKGLAKEDMTQLLYTFNYTVGFHGHFEEGYRNGAKQGYYFITGRNGVRTRVDYVADEKGFRPKITQEVLDLLSDDVPKPETEKDEKYGLKGYEFKWLYFPVESKGH